MEIHPQLCEPDENFQTQSCYLSTAAYGLRRQPDMSDFHTLSEKKISQFSLSDISIV